MVTFLGLPFITLLVILQSSIISRLNISYGKADIVLVFLIAWTLLEKKNNGIWWSIFAGIGMSLISALPAFSYFLVYVATTVACKFLKDRLWNVPMLTMVIMGFLGSVLASFISYIAISFTQVQLPLIESIQKIMLPSAALNILVGIPIFILAKDLVEIVEPGAIE